MNTNKLIPLALFIELAAVTGCGDNASVTGVSPAQAFAGRTKRLEITGEGTTWSDGATVNLGEGVTVDSVQVASPTDLFADISVDSKAALGARDLTVIDGGTFTLEAALELMPPVEIVMHGNLGQGGGPHFTLVNHDLEHPFDATTASPPSNFYPNLKISGPAKVQVYIDDATASTISGWALLDLDAMAGDLSVQSGVGAAAITSNCTLGIVPRTPTSLSGSTTGMISDIGDSGLYSIAVSDPKSLVHISVSTSDPQASTGVGIFTDDTWADISRFPNRSPHELIDGPATVTFLVIDHFHSGYQYTVSALSETPTSAPEGDDTANGLGGGALVATALPFEQIGGTLSSAKDVDYISFTVSAADANRHAHVITNAGADPLTDTRVDLWNTAGKDYLLGYGSTPVDGTDCYPICHSSGEDVISDPLPAGTYYVVISAGPAYSLADQAYTALIWLD